MMRRYSFRLYPKPEQAFALHGQRRMMAELWNALLHRREDVYRRERRTLTRFDLEYEITGLYRECPEWRALSTWCARRVNKSLDDAFQAFFRRTKAGAGREAGYPKYKRTRDGDRIPHRCTSGCRLLPAPREHSGDRKNADSARNRNFALRLKGIDGLIHARGKYPGFPIDYLDADVIWRDGEWWLSICVEVQPGREHGSTPVVIEMDCLDGLARVDGETWTPAAFARLQAMQDHVDRLKSERDRRWKRRAPHDPEWCEANAEISRLSARIARCRNNELHVWTARIVHIASAITIHAPKVKENTQSPRGDEKQWGAAVDTVSKLNRKTLSYAPALAVQMLKYKAEEAGIRCNVIETVTPDIAVGAKLVAAGKAVRKAKRAIRRQNHNEHDQQRTVGPRRGDRGSIGAGRGSLVAQG